MIYLLALGSAVLYGAADFAGGLTTRRVGTIPVVVLSQASGLILLLLIMPLLPDTSPARSDLLWGVAAGLTGGIGVALLYRALAIGTMAVVAPTTAVCAVAVPVLISVFLGERPLPLAIAGIALGIGSIILVSQAPEPPEDQSSNIPQKRRASGVGTALASGVAIGFFLLTLARSGSNAGMWPLVVARSVSVALFVTIALARRISLRMPPSMAGLALLCGAIDMLANALYLLAGRVGPLSTVVTLASLYPASTVLLARIVLGERLTKLQISGVGCALAAVVLIVSSGK